MKLIDYISDEAFEALLLTIFFVGQCGVLLIANIRWEPFPIYTRAINYLLLFFIIPLVLIYCWLPYFLQLANKEEKKHE